MSFFGALGTAVQGINAQATAIGHISDNVANASTVGYKTVNTYFSDLVNNKVLGDSPVIDSTRHMGVLAKADFANRKQGTIIRDASPSSIAVTGQGFIPVAKPTGTDPLTGEPTAFETATYFTRLGDFRMDSSNRLVNSAGYYLRAAEAGGTVPADFVVDTSDIAAVPTSTVDYSINLPGSALPGRTITTGIGVVDANSEEQNFQVIWNKSAAADTWTMNINTTMATPNSFGPVTVTFNNGTLQSMTTTDTNLTVSNLTGAATVALSVDYGAGPQAITLNLGTFGAAFDVTATSGLTQYTSNNTDASNNIITQNGLLGGTFDYLTFEDDGNIVYNYSNGRSQVGGQLLLGNFPEPDRLDRVDGTAFLATGRNISGAVVYGQPGDPLGTTGVGKLIAGALEQSTVDIAEQMTKLMVAQQAYSMNGQVISAADSMLSRAVDMKR